MSETRITPFPRGNVEQAGLYFSLLAEPTRLKILSTLCDGERSVSDIVAAIGAGQANVSRQLNLLYRSNILKRRKEGTHAYYRVQDATTIELCRGICRKTVMMETGAATCRRPDNSCRIGAEGAICRWQPTPGKTAEHSA